MEAIDFDTGVLKRNYFDIIPLIPEVMQDPFTEHMTKEDILRPYYGRNTLTLVGYFSVNFSRCPEGKKWFERYMEIIREKKREYQYFVTKYEN